MEQPTCSASEDCDRTDLVGYDKFCRKHYQRWRTTGDPLTEPRNVSAEVSARKTHAETQTGLRQCNVCSEFKPLDDFAESATNRNGRFPSCKPCRKATAKVAHQRRVQHDPEGHRRRYRNRHLQSSYGLSVDEYDAMVAAQHGKCAACGAKTKLVLDHDHETGHVRGLICNPCNLALGFAEDSIKRLEQLRTYLYKHKGRLV